MTPPLLIALQVGPIPEHMDQARELLKLIVEIEPEPRRDIEFALCVSRGLNKPYCQEMIGLASTRFKSVLIRSHRMGSGWPMGCNDLWQCSMSQVHALARDGRIKADGVLTFEPDCIPLRPDWLDCLKEEWQRAREARKLVIGHMAGEPQVSHINGNAIFHVNIIGLHPVLAGCDARAGWDVYHSALLLRMGLDTPMICQWWRMQNISLQHLRELRKDGQIPALFHGIKDMSGIEGVRALLKSGEFDQRVPRDEGSKKKSLTRVKILSKEEMDTFRRATRFKPPIVKPPPTPPVIQPPVEAAAQLSAAPLRAKTIAKPGEITFSISVLAFNKLRLTQDCLDSVMRHSSSYELLLWDNHSTDGIREYFDELSKKHRHIRVTHSPTNLGFIKPNLEHLKMARGKYLVLLNNDTHVPEGWLEALEQPFQEHPNAALSGPSGTCCELGRDFHGRPGQTLEYIEGSCLCVPVALLRKHGFFNNNLRFAYGEDSDLSLRMRELGYTIHHAPFRIDHVGSATSRGMPEIKAIQRHNHDVLQKRWGHYLKVRKMDYPILIRRHGSLGDVLLTTPIVRALRAQRPLSRIIIETTCPEIYRDNPSTNAIRNAGSTPDEMLVFDLNMAYENRKMTPIIQAYEDVAQVTCENQAPEMFLRDQDTHFAEQYLKPGEKWAALACTQTTWEAKNWPTERWQELAATLLEMGWKVLLVGTWLPVNAPRDLDLINLTTLHQLAAVLARCELCVGHDSFPMHCSIAMGRPTIGLFGVTLPEIILPKVPWAFWVTSDPSHPGSGARHRVTGKTEVKCQSNPMETITVEQVVEAVKSIK